MHSDFSIKFLQPGEISFSKFHYGTMKLWENLTKIKGLKLLTDQVFTQPKQKDYNANLKQIQFFSTQLRPKINFKFFKMNTVFFPFVLRSSLVL